MNIIRTSNVWATAFQKCDSKYIIKAFKQTTSKEISKTKLYKNEEQITYEILFLVTVFVTTKKKNRKRKKEEAKYISWFIF